MLATDKAAKPWFRDPLFCDPLPAPRDVLLAPFALLADPRDALLACFVDLEDVLSCDRDPPFDEPFAALCFLVCFAMCSTP
jgi:hypothetical protein